jgi:uncharacterized membrane protein
MFRVTSTYFTAPIYRWKLVRIMRVRWRLFLSAIVGLFVFLLLPPDWRLINRILTGWDVGVGVYLLLAIELAMSTDTNHIRPRCHLYDEGRVAIPVLTIIAALASIGAIFLQLSSAPVHHRFLNLEFAMGTILLSWSFIQVMFAFHYAHEFYAEHRGEAGGLGFPGEQPPDYWDFLYFAFVSDVTVVELNEENRDGPWSPLIHLQCHVPRARRQPCRERTRNFGNLAIGSTCSSRKFSAALRSTD